MSQFSTTSKKIPAGTPSCRISCKKDLTGNEGALIRKEIMSCIAKSYHTVYLDTKEVNYADLSGINEVIHSAYLFAGTNTEFILVYRKKSVVEKWVETTRLDKFVKTAIIPAP